MKKRKILFLIILLLLCIGVYIHTNPNRALRFTVLIYGFPKEAFSSEIAHSGKEGDIVNFYQLEPTTVGNTGPMILWKTTKIGPLYFSKYYGSH
ncbi:hypothetical protein JZO79_11945 [Vagococcus fluvialis]|uniref:hypothetical protein n=1 Tax=Vagococcus fluvialis TaxID=2738 RepID=UPI001A8FA70C|nr:hypothetical protein [Vagococcus fluvialis]MBO0444326.1 hypothetical protein [Vagococcus fluvialis]